MFTWPSASDRGDRDRLPTYVQVIEELGKADASTGWREPGAIYGTYAAHAAGVARAIWIDTPRGVVANTPAPTAQAVVVPGGYASRASGLQHRVPARFVGGRHAQVIEKGEVRLENGLRRCAISSCRSRKPSCWTRGIRGACAARGHITSPSTTCSCRGAHGLVGDGSAPERRPALQDSAHPGLRLRRCRSGARHVSKLSRAFFDLAGSKTPRAVQGLLRDNR